MATPTYIKPSIVNKIVPPKNTEPNIQNQVADIKKQYGNLSTEELYSAMLSVKPPAEQDILQAVGKQYGYLDRLDGLREQAWAIQRKMLSDQTPMFSAVGKDGKPVDPRIITSQFQENMTRDIQRLNQIQKVQDTYKAEMQAIAGAISDQYKSKAQETQTAIQFLQQLNQEKNADRSYNLQRDQFEYQKQQGSKPNYVYENGQWVDKNSSVAPWMQGPAPESTVESGTTQNRPDRNNNPWNVKLVPGYDVSKIPGAIWVDDQNHLRFATPQDWYNWMMRDISAKLSGNTRTWLTPESTLADLGKVYAEDPGWGSNVARISGYWLGTKLKDIDVKRLALAIARQEWFTGKVAPITQNSTPPELTSADIALFNSAKYNPQTDTDNARAAKYVMFQNNLAKVMSDPNAKIEDKMKYSQGWKALTESPNKNYKDIGLVVSQLDNIGNAIEKYNKSTWFWDALNPIQWLISNVNPWDTKAQDVKAQLQGIVPKVARGIFWEVWVLTDLDIANYLQTLPNIKQTADVQDVVQLALLGTLKSAIENNIAVDSATYDTSGLIGNYKKIQNKIDELQARVSDGVDIFSVMPQGRYTGSGAWRWQQSQGGAQ